MSAARKRQRDDELAAIAYVESAAHSTSICAAASSRSIAVVIEKQPICIECIMQFLDVDSIMMLAKTSRSLLFAARKPFAWKYVPTQFVNVNAKNTSLSQYRPDLLNMFTTSLMLVDISVVDSALMTSSERNMHMLRYMRITTIEFDVWSLYKICVLKHDVHLLQAVSDVSKLIMRGVNPQLDHEVWRLLTAIVQRSRALRFVGLGYLPGIAHDFARALARKTGITDLRFDIRDLESKEPVRAVIASPHLRQSLLRLSIAVHWWSSYAPDLFGQLAGFQSLVSLYIGGCYARSQSSSSAVRSQQAAERLAASIPASVRELRVGVWSGYRDSSVPFYSQNPQRWTSATDDEAKQMVSMVALVAQRNSTIKRVIIELECCAQQASIPLLLHVFGSAVHVAFKDIDVETELVTQIGLYAAFCE